MAVTKRDLRDHGYPDMGEKAAGRPKAVPMEKKDVGDGCPNCHCMELMMISVEMDNPMLKGGKGLGTYVGCPACPWASQMMTRAVVGGVQ